MKAEISENITRIVKEAADVDLNSEKIKEEIRVRFLYSKGLLFDLTIRQFAILASLCPDTVYRNKTKYGFGKNNRTSIYNLRAYLSGKVSVRDARNIRKKRILSSSNFEHSEIPAQRGKGD